MGSYNVKIYYYDSETQYRVYEKPIHTKEKSTDIPEEKCLHTADGQ